MTVINYKVLVAIEFDGKKFRPGEEVVLPERDASKFVKEGSLAIGRTLDPNDPKDAKAIEAAEADHDTRYEAEKGKEDARDAQKQDELKEDDAKRAELLEEASTLVSDTATIEKKDVDPSRIEKLQTLETAEIEKAVEELRDQKVKVEEAYSLPPTTKPRSK